MPNWTDEQLRAIEARGGNILLSAAAGSGKTTVLVDPRCRVGHALQAVPPAQRAGCGGG